MTLVLEGIQLAVTVFGSLIAAVAAVWNLIYSLRKGADKIKVKSGPATTSFDEGDYLTIINRSEHEVRLSDYGFVIKHDNNYQFKSIPIEIEYGSINVAEVVSKGTTVIQQRDYFEIGYPGNSRTIAYYGRTINMSRPKIDWLDSTPIVDRIRVKTKLLLNRQPLSWN